MKIICVVDKLGVVYDDFEVVNFTIPKVIFVALGLERSCI